MMCWLRRKPKPVGTVTGYLKLDRSQWDAAIARCKADIDSLTSYSRSAGVAADKATQLGAALTASQDPSSDGVL